MRIATWICFRPYEPVILGLVHSAKSFEKHGGGKSTLTLIQSEILDILKETGGIEPKALIQRLGGKLTQKELEREFAALPTPHGKGQRGKTGQPNCLADMVIFWIVRRHQQLIHLR